MNLRIVYDSQGLPRYKTGWGFSCLVTTQNGNVLFDCGWDASVLLANLEKMGIRAQSIDGVVISHAHWDHIGGLPGFLSERGQECPVFVPSSFSHRLKEEIALRARLIEVSSEGRQVLPHVFTSSEMGKETKEIALFLHTSLGLVVFSGCMHNGEKLLGSLGSGELHMIIGGFHNTPTELFPYPYDYLVAPCHCTRERQALRKAFGKKYIDVGVGSSFPLTEHNPKEKQPQKQ